MLLKLRNESAQLAAQDGFVHAIAFLVIFATGRGVSWGRYPLKPLNIEEFTAILFGFVCRRLFVLNGGSVFVILLNVKDSFRNANTASPRQRTVFVSERIQLNEAAPLHCSYDRALWALHRQVSRVNKENDGGHRRVGLGLWLFCGKMLA